MGKIGCQNRPFVSLKHDFDVIRYFYQIINNYKFYENGGDWNVIPKTMD